MVEVSEDTGMGRPAWGCSSQATATDRRNARVMNIWMAVWMATFLVALAVVESREPAGVWLILVALAATALTAVPALRAYLHFLRQADELTRLIQLQAMAVGFAAGVVASVLERFVVQLIAVTPLPDKLTAFLTPFMVMIFAFMIAVIALTRRYAA